MKKLVIVAAVLVAVSAPMAHAATTASKSKGKSTAGSPYIMASAKQTQTLKIIAIDKDKRIVTLLSAAGDTVDVKCGKEVRNFNKLAVGDDVKTTYSESYSIHVEQGGEAGETKEVATSRAPVGGTPEAAIYETRQVSAKVDAVDKAKGTVTLATMSGEKFTITPQNKANLDKLAVGNTVVVTERIGNAISVSKPGASTAKSSSKSKKKS
jgi:hypothetical protein